MEKQVIPYLETKQILLQVKAASKLRMESLNANLTLSSSTPRKQWPIHPGQGSASSFTLYNVFTIPPPLFLHRKEKLSVPTHICLSFIYPHYSCMFFIPKEWHSYAQDWWCQAFKYCENNLKS